MTKKIEDFVREGNFSEGDELLQLYSHFIVDFEKKINPLSLARFTLAAAKQYKGEWTSYHSHLDTLISLLGPRRSQGCHCLPPEDF